MNKTIEQLQKQLQQEKEVNKYLKSENEELKKINSGTFYLYEQELNYYRGYQRYIPYIDRMRKSIFFKIFKKLRGRR